MTVRDFMASVDARIFKSKVVQDVLLIGSTRIEGAFFEQPRELSLPGADIQAVQLSFECRYESKIGNLENGDIVTIEGHGRYRFKREVLPGGDESGITVIELGELVE